MGQTTPNMGIYIPAAGETNYEQSFASGMMNVDQHDHSGGPNKGVPIQTSGLADFSVTYDKLNSNVVDSTTGIGTQGGSFQNRLQLLGYLANLYQRSIAASPVGFVVMNGGVAEVRTFQDTASVKWMNANGTGVPSANVDIAGLTPVVVANGGTGRTSLTAYALLSANTTSTGAVQQPALGTSGQVLTSNGPGAFATYQALPTPAVDNVQIATVTLTASQFRNLSGTPIVLIPALGAGKIAVVYRVWGKLNYGAIAPFGSGSSVRIYWGISSDEVGFVFTSGSFKDSALSYYSSDITNTSSTSGYTTFIENQDITISVNSSNFTGGNGNTVTFWASYSVMQI